MRETQWERCLITRLQHYLKRHRIVTILERYAEGVNQGDYLEPLPLYPAKAMHFRSNQIRLSNVIVSGSISLVRRLLDEDDLLQ
jgi:hypothetical protein